MAVNAVSRQVVQNLNLHRFYDVLGQKTELQFGPLLMFLITFVIGLIILAWMITQAVRARGNPLGSPSKTA